MGLETDEQRRWWFANLGRNGMRPPNGMGDGDRKAYESGLLERNAPTAKGDEVTISMGWTPVASGKPWAVTAENGMLLARFATPQEAERFIGDTGKLNKALKSKGLRQVQ